MPAETKKPKPDYGVDAPKVVRNFFLLGAGASLGGLALAMFGPGSVWMATLIGTGIVGGSIWIATAGLMLFGSKVLKVRLRERLLDGGPMSAAGAIQTNDDRSEDCARVMEATP